MTKTDLPSTAVTEQLYTLSLLVMNNKQMLMHVEGSGRGLLQGIILESV
jgi:hypothetical protein